MTALHRALKTCRSVGRWEGGVWAQGLGRPAALGMGSQAAEVGDGPDGWGPSVSERERERRLFGLEWAI